MVRINACFSTIFLAAIVLASMLSSATGTTSTAIDACQDELILCGADADCTACLVDTDHDCGSPSGTDDNITCDELSDWYCCVVEAVDCLENDLLTDYIDCTFSETSGCSDDLDCFDSSGVAGTVDAAVFGSPTMASFVGIITTVAVFLAA